MDELACSVVAALASAWTEQHSIYEALLFPAGVVAGVINVIAGGGSFLTLPILIASGLPVEIANGTNRISVVVQGLFATWDYQKKGTLDGPLFKTFLPPLLVGAIAGAYLATMVEPDRLARIFGVLFLLMGTYLTVSARLRARRPTSQAEASSSGEPPRSETVSWVHVSTLFLVGVYGGFIQAGVGLLILLVGSHLLRLDTVRVNAIKLPLTLTFTIPAVILFLQANMVRWIPGLILAAGTLVGAKLGVRLSIQGGHRLIMRAVTIVLLLTGLRLCLR